MKIFYLLQKIKDRLSKQSERKKLRKKILLEGDSYSFTAENITNSISKSKELYKDLIIKVHPDRFEEKYKKEATELSSKITKNKKDYHSLLELKKEVEEFLQKNTLD